MNLDTRIHQISARKFIHYCHSKFGWRDLSNDVIMDVGCGEDGFGGKSILENFPDAKVIFMDKLPQVVRKFTSQATQGMECIIADIEKRESLTSYEGKMTKVVSSHVFHQLMMKEEAFQNVYHLLKPGGQAAILFITKSLLYDWLTEMLKIPKWKALYKGHFVMDLYQSEFDTVKYREIVEKIGFHVVECYEELRVIPSESDEVCKEALYRMSGNGFQIPPELIAEFKNESFQVLLQLSERDENGRACYRATELTMLLVKPAAAVSSERKDNL